MNELFIPLIVAGIVLLVAWGAWELFAGAAENKE